MTFKRLVVAVYRYAIEVSPIIKNLASYFHDQGYEVLILTDKLYRQREFSVDYATILTANVNHLTQTINKLRGKPLQLHTEFKQLLKQQIRQDDLILAIDYVSLHLLHEVRAPLERTIYLSVEGIDFLKHYSTTEVIDCLHTCAMRLIPNLARHKDIENFLHNTLPFDYLPVAARTPLQPKGLKKRRPHQKPSIIYSGYFAPWAGLLEFLQLVKREKVYDLADILLHGHVMGTDAYFEEVKEMARSIPNVTVDTTYYDDETYATLLSHYDIGLALYDDKFNNTNFHHLVNSSGKIAAYLWSGLAVITNIPEDDIITPPFLKLHSLSTSSLTLLIEDYLSRRDEFQTSALTLAKEAYSLDTVMDQLLPKLLSL